jgi:hypothetical protein
MTNTKYALLAVMALAIAAPAVSFAADTSTPPAAGADAGTPAKVVKAKKVHKKVKKHKKKKAAAAPAASTTTTPSSDGNK